MDDALVSVLQVHLASLDVKSRGHVLPAFFVHEPLTASRRLVQTALDAPGCALSHLTYMVLIKDVISLRDTGCRVVPGVVGSLSVPSSAHVCEPERVDKPDDYAPN